MSKSGYVVKSTGLGVVDPDSKEYVTYRQGDTVELSAEQAKRYLESSPPSIVKAGSAEAKAAEEPAPGQVDLSSFANKSELQTYAQDQDIDGVDESKQSREEMEETISAALQARSGGPDNSKSIIPPGTSGADLQGSGQGTPVA